jgi:VCBS repeat-containing protein
MLAAGAREGASVLILDPNRDGIEQITSALRQYADITSLHIVCHGSPGCLHLGSAPLNLNTLDRYASTLQTWNVASLLLYGCQVASRKEGATLIERLHHLTGASIAASANPTGAAALGGDWALEVTLGRIEAPLAFPVAVREAYPAVLATFTVNNNGDFDDGDINNGVTTLREAINAANALAGDDIIAFDLSASTSSAIALTSTLPAIASNVQFDGSGTTGLEISGDNSFQIFSVESGIVSFLDLTITDGLAQGGAGSNAGSLGGGGGGGAGLGGGLFIEDGTVTVDNVTFSNNQAIGGNGGSGGSGGSGSGGNGGNGSNGGFGGSGGSVSSTGGTGEFGGGGGGGGGLSGNGGTGGFGGGGGGGGGNIGFSAGGTGGSGGDFGGSGAGGSGGLTGGSGGGGGGGAGLGGAIFIQSGALNLANVTFENNSAQGGTGAGGTSGQGKGGGIFIGADATVSGDIGTLTFNGNTASDAGTSSEDNNDIFGTISSSFGASDDTATTDEDTVIAIAVLSNDSIGPATSISGVDTANALGTVAINPDGTLSYDPTTAFQSLAVGESTTDSFSYTIADSAGNTDTATVTVTITGVNDAPIAADDSTFTDADTAISIAVLANDSDPDGDALQIDSFDSTSTAGGSISLDDGGTPDDFTDDSLIYTPPTNFIGADSFSYAIADGNGGTSTATVNLTVNAAFSLADLNGSNGFRINGINPSDRAGFLVSDAGDVNGDGFADFAIGAIGFNAGDTYIVFGGTNVGASGSFDLANLDGSNGFVLTGIDRATSTAFSLSSAGDFNGDGFGDFLIGAPGASPNGTFAAGQGYVVFGSATLGAGGSFDLTTLEAERSLDGSNGFVLPGIADSERIGSAVSEAGDVNGDGFTDLIIAAPSADPNGINAAGKTYIVFGGATVGTSGSVDLSAFDGSNGFVVNGISEFDTLGRAVSSAGDINNDGFADFIIGAPQADPNGIESAGQSYVILGSADVGAGGSLDLANLEAERSRSLDGSNGFVLNGIEMEDDSGWSVSGGGDVNGDGFADLIIGAPYAEPNGTERAGETYVVFGQAGGFSASIDLSGLDGSNGFVINGAATDEASGYAVSRAGDINGDGLADLIIGASGSDFVQDSPGKSYVVFGQADGFSATLDLANLGTQGFRIDGIVAGDRAGIAVSDTGDVNGDGIDDLIVGASGADPNGNDGAGESYVLFGNAAPELDLNGEASGVDFTTTFTGNPVSVTDSANLTLTDPNNTTLVGATITITNPLDGVAEVLTADFTGTNIAGNYDDTTGTLTLSGEDTLVNYQQVLGTLTYNNTAATPDTADRAIAFTVNDGGIHSNTSALAMTTLTLTSTPILPGI